MDVLPIGVQDLPPLHGCSLESAEDSVRQVHGLVDSLRQEGIPADRIYVGGFQQGGALALLAGLTYQQRLAGCIVFSGLLLGADRVGTLAGPAARGLRVFWGHGLHDGVFDVSLQDEGCNAVKEFGLDIQLVVLPMVKKGAVAFISPTDKSNRCRVTHGPACLYMFIMLSSFGRDGYANLFINSFCVFFLLLPHEATEFLNDMPLRVPEFD
ncbi:unnamed protein product [Prorocentrum cordatum]|uniref:Phospholipase/carboxylesterase/thioesterase domain-containing protein n=1 Tax=Prorocentrum cordatum TaxID=2364126 RepID=A0ABN9RUU5_9DINO|nr:unnamed protein product [Polarella glacialis]